MVLQMHLAWIYINLPACSGSLEQLKSGKGICMCGFIFGEVRTKYDPLGEGPTILSLAARRLHD